MSTVDPDAARRERAARVPTEKDLVVPGILAFLGGAVVTGSIVATAQVPAAGAVDENTAGLLVAMGGVLLGGLVTIGALIFWGRASFRNPRLLGWVTPVAFVILGSAVAFFFVTGSFVLPSALVGVAALVFVLALTARQRRLSLIDLEDRIVRESTPVEGIVTNQGYTHFGESNRILTAVTYAFDDAQGTRRFVQRGAMIDIADPVVEGERVDVWFDRLNPSDEKRIVVRRRRKP